MPKTFAPLHAGVADGGQRVGRLARLRYGHDQRRGRDDGVAVAELAGDLHLAGNARPALDEVLGGKTRMVGGAARDNVDAIDQVELGRRSWMRYSLYLQDCMDFLSLT